MQTESCGRDRRVCPELVRGRSTGRERRGAGGVRAEVSNILDSGARGV